MQQFRSLPIFVNSLDIPDSRKFPHVQPHLPGSVVPTPVKADAVSSAGGPYDAGRIYEKSVMEVLETIVGQEVGRLVLSLLPTDYPVLIRQMTKEDIKRIGECNAETSPSGDTLRTYPRPVRGHGSISFTPNFSFQCVARGPACQPHEILFHELVHAYNQALHGGSIRNVVITGGTGPAGSFSEGPAFDGIEDFLAIVVTNMYVSEYSLDLRYHHRGYAKIPSTLSSSISFYNAFSKAFNFLAEDTRRLCNLLSLLSRPRFNPFKVHFDKEKHELYHSDFFPTDPGQKF